MTTISAHMWSALSLTLTFSLLLTQQLVLNHLRGQRVPFADWQFAGSFEALLGWGTLASAVLSIVGVIKEPRPWLGLLALLIAGFLFLAWGYSA